MQKTAQRRGILDKLREFTDVSGKAAEKFFNPQFKAVMDEIRLKDDQIRSIVVGSKIGTFGDPGEPVAMKDLLKQAKSNINRREYLTAVSDLSKFHKKAKDIIAHINEIKTKVDEVHHDFLFKGLKPQHLEELQDLRKRLAAQQKAEMIKEASILDFLKTLTPRGRALAAWEKRYPNEVKKIRDGALTILDRSQNLLDTIISSLKEMAHARSVRNPDEYMKAAAKIEKSFMPYENGKGGFKEYYNTTLKTWFDRLDRTQQAETGAGTGVGPAPTAQELGKQKVPVEGKPPVTLEMPPLPQAAPGAAPAASTTVPAGTTAPAPAATAPQLPVPPGASPPFAPPPATTVEEEAPVTVRSPAPKHPVEGPELEAASSVRHQQFFKSLEALAGESPSILASYIGKYARSIQVDDPGTAIQLMRISKKIKG